MSLYLGIDLGTSNSAICGSNGGAPRLFKTAEGSDVLRSAVMLDGRGRMLVGQRAYEQAAFSPEDVQQGFKRLMGTQSPLLFPSCDRTMSPEEASAEIVRALLAQARSAAGDFEILGAVVAIPAAFNQMQCEATMRAAASAGLTKVGLLQEPVAAALASIAGSSDRNGRFLVYDLGGGTFDAALVQSVGGAANVVAHAGINMLGGRDFDRGIIETIVRPWLDRHFRLPPDLQADPTYQRILRVARHRSEITKIALSTQAADRIFADEREVGIQDLDGRDVYLDIEVRRADLEALVVPQVDRSIDLCRRLVLDNGYRPEDIDRIVFIGGPSRMPVVRERVSQRLGIAADLATDPMTAVATGAAIFAEGRDWSGGASVAKPSRASVGGTGAAGFRLDHPSRTADSRVRLRFKPGPGFGEGFRVRVTGSDGWTSGPVAVEGPTAINDVPLPLTGENGFRIEVLDAGGAAVPGAGREISILRTPADAAGIPATKTIAAKVAEGAAASGRNALLPFIGKGALLPARGTLRMRAAKELRAGDGTHIDLDLYEQAEGVTDPEASLGIGAFRIRSSDLERGDVIRRGDEILCLWEMSDSNLLTCRLQVPAIGRTFDSGHMYVPTGGQQNFEGPEGTGLAAAMIDMADDELSGLRTLLGGRLRDEADDLMDRVADQRTALSGAWEADAKRLVAEEARMIRQDIARVRGRPEFTGNRLTDRRELLQRQFHRYAADLADEKTSASFHRLLAHADDAVARGTPEAFADAEASLDEALAIVRPIVRGSPTFLVDYYDTMCARRALAIDKARHDRLAEEGRRAIDGNDLPKLHAAAARMRRNMIAVPLAGEAAELAGLMRY